MHAIPVSQSLPETLDPNIFSSPSSPKVGSEPQGHITEQVQTIWNPYKNRYRVLASCILSFANGMNDSAPGALIASLERDYNIAYGTVSIIFVCNALGFIAAAFFISTLSTRIGRAKSLMISEALLMIGYTAIVTTPPFGVVAASFFVTGVGMAMNLAICQVFCANLANNTALVGAYQGAYGIGGIFGPLIATALVSRGSKWSRFYIIELCLAALNFGIAPRTFWKYEQESKSLLPQPASEQQDRERGTVKRNDRTKRQWQSFKTLMSNKPTVLGALFIFAYQGSEVAISGWIISFLVQFRHGDPSKVGFVTSGFWAGITLGRFTLSFLAHRIGERTFVFFVTVGALILELLIWFVPSIPGDSVAVAFSGLLLGPVYPCAVHVFQRLIPRKMQISSLSLIGSVGSSGGAVAPFMTGMLAQHVGTFVLHPICIGLFVCMGISWFLLPKAERRDE
ncbi:MFS general substrate transporter [Mollisia scopiformis]|uniref:MFS general substrate transporter n=1 Tax=Mollisia scopiformis TaxID=149040 RepID=A0A194XNA9_MOLSC|nr:MFS general substrate transporter [Mollisia scopiformis]KUJ21658.1 MFS general substrate transporter [Mollisia scopiformis]